MSTEPQGTDSPATEDSGDEARPVEESVPRAAVDAYVEASMVEEELLPAPNPDTSDDRIAAADANPELSAVRAEASDYREQLLRARAEIENSKRRHANELEKAHKYALDGFVRELLQVRDSLELGHSAAMDETSDIAKLREGTELTLKLLEDVMSKFGVDTVDPRDEPFDPERHQAISMQPRSDVPPNSVVAVIQKGYTLNGRLVRPAMVLVSQQQSG